MEREVRHCTTEDGVRIAYCVEGEGLPLMAIPFFIESFSLDHLFPEYHRFLLKIAEGKQLIRFDPRGIGPSQRDVADYSPEARIADGIAVANACGPKRWSIWASTTTGAFAIKFALAHPERVENLLLYGTCAKITDAFSPDVLNTFAMLANANWPLACRTYADLTGRVGFPFATRRTVILSSPFC